MEAQQRIEIGSRKGAGAQAPANDQLILVRLETGREVFAAITPGSGAGDRAA